MFSLRSVNAITKASIASRVVASIPKVAAPSIQRAFISSGASRKEPVVPSEPTGITATKNVNPLVSGVSNQLSPTLKKFTLDGKVAVVTG
jgi:hypothetical protein